MALFFIGIMSKLTGFTFTPCRGTEQILTYPFKGEKYLELVGYVSLHPPYFLANWLVTALIPRGERIHRIQNSHPWRSSGRNPSCGRASAD